MYMYTPTDTQTHTNTDKHMQIYTLNLLFKSDSAF